MKEILKNKKFLSVYLVWILLHTFLLLQNRNDFDSYITKDFWPFTDHGLRAYDISEWAAYVFGPVVILFLVVAFNDKTTKLILILLSFHFFGNAQIVEKVTPELADPKEGLSYKLPPAPKQKPLPLLKDERTRKIKNAKPAFLNVFDSALSQPATWEAKTQTRGENGAAKAQGDNSAENIAANTQPEAFDWKATNADRFVNSPCFHELGFNPYADPIEQEKRYQQCEGEKRMKSIKYFALILVTIIGFIGLIYLGMRKRQLKAS